jgi:hypothetical protein
MSLDDHHYIAPRDPVTGRVPPHPLVAGLKDPTTTPLWAIGSFGGRAEINDDKRGVSEVETRLLAVIEDEYKKLQRIDKTHRGSRAWGEQLFAARAALRALEQIGPSQRPGDGKFFEGIEGVSTKRGYQLALDWRTRLY